jgi:hypothetical protein
MLPTAAHEAIGWFSAALVILMLAITGPKIVAFLFRLRKRPLWDQVQDPRHITVEWLAGLVGVYVVVAVCVTIVLPNWHQFRFAWWTWDIYPNYKLWWSLAMCLGVPGILFLLIAHSMPGPYSCCRMWWRRRRHENRYNLANSLQRVSFGQVQVGQTVHEITSNKSYVVRAASSLPGGWRQMVLRSNYAPQRGEALQHDLPYEVIKTYRAHPACQGELSPLVHSKSA